MEEHEGRMAQVIGSEARDALHGQRRHMLHERQVLHQAGERAKEFVNSQTHLELQSHVVSYRRSLHDREVLQERLTQTMEYQEAQLRVQLQTEELMITSLQESFQETSESERQAVISAPELAAVSSNRNVAGNNGLCILEKRSDKTYQESGG